jgi:hypothetical protein
VLEGEDIAKAAGLENLPGFVLSFCLEGLVA